MPLRVRAWTLVAGLTSICLLVMLLLYAPPDGQERAEFAQFLGRFHPLIVHIPIALLLLVPILECAGVIQQHLRQAAGFVLALAVAAAIVAALFAWTLDEFEDYLASERYALPTTSSTAAVEDLGLPVIDAPSETLRRGSEWFGGQSGGLYAPLDLKYLELL